MVCNKRIATAETGAAVWAEISQTDLIAMATLTTGGSGCRDSCVNGYGEKRHKLLG